MKRTHLYAMLAFLCASSLFVEGEYSQAKFSGDLRLRVERDYNVTGKDDRDRLRYRFRFNILKKNQNGIEIGTRMVSGNPGDQQSPHQTLGSDFSAKSFSMDKVFLKYAIEEMWAWFGKNSFPFWKQNEFFWDDDVNPEGFSGGYEFKNILGTNSHVALTGGVYVIDNFDQLTAPSLTAGQISVAKKTSNWGVKAAGGIFSFKNEENDTSSAAYNPLDNMDHRIIVAEGQVGYEISPSFPFKIGGTFLKNLLKPNFAGFEDQTAGYVAQMSLGQLKAKGNFLFGIYYAHIEKYAVIANFAQDDWWRFGSGHANSSNFQGLEARIGCQLTKKMNALIRHYFAETIKGSQEAGRVRLDLNSKF